MNKLAFRLYIIFIISFFLSLPERFSVLAAIRFDLLMVMFIFVVSLIGKDNSAHNVNFESRSPSRASLALIVLIAYVVVTLPLVRWSGSVLNLGLPNLIKAVIFFYFTVSLVATEKRLKTLISVFLICQVIRVLEPLYMNYTSGYWGSQTYVEGDMVDRLSGAPTDVINPNGLAFTIVSVIPFLYYLNASSGKLYRLLFIAVMPLLIYALLLTASRTGILALAIVLFAIYLKSKRKILLSIVSVVGLSFIFANLTDFQRDRYLSIFSRDTKSAETAGERSQGLVRDFNVAMKRPFFGHGMGTSIEANTHVSGVYLIAHNLYLEILQELGFFGLIIFLYYIKEIIKNFLSSLTNVKKNLSKNLYMLNIIHAMQVWLTMNILFSFASYGLSNYEWYLFGGLSVVMTRLSAINANNTSQDRVI